MVRSFFRCSLNHALYAFLPALLFLTSCSFRDYRNEVRQLDSASIVLTVAQQQLKQVDTLTVIIRIKELRMSYDSLRKLENKGDTTLSDAKEKYASAGKSYSAVIKEIRRLNREIEIMSGQLQRLKKDMENQAFDEISAKEYTQAEISSVDRLTKSINRFMQLQAEEIRKWEDLKKK